LTLGVGRVSVGGPAFFADCANVDAQAEILPLLDEAAEQMIAADMQPKLERFRLEHYHQVRVPELPGSSAFTPRCGRSLVCWQHPSWATGS
jgi:hypothetical protein